MTTDNQLAVIDQQAITPEQFQRSMNDAVAKAKTLADIVESQKLYNMIGGGKHLRVEAWQTIAVGYGLTPGIAEATILYDNEGIEIGAKAKSVIYDAAGTIRGGAEAYCMRSEPNWKTKPVHQLLSMAGTRAVSKALRLLLAWVVVLAGYEPTPAEEMSNDNGKTVEAPKPRQRQTQQPKTLAMSLEDLQDWVAAQGMDWETFVEELKVGTWEEFTAMGGTPAAAKARWDHEQEKKK